MRLSRLGFAIAVPFILPLCGCATDILGPTSAVEGKLTDIEREYVQQIYGACTLALGLQSDVDEIVRQDVDTVLSDTNTRTVVLGVIRGAHAQLSEQALILRQPAPYTMDSLAPINESVAAVLEGAYVPCIEVVEKEVAGAPAAWGSSSLGELLSLQGIVGEVEPSVAAQARILACVRRESQTLGDAAHEALAALGAKEEEIKSGRYQAADKGVDCFIATAAYGSSSAAEIDVLRSFRDDVLLRSCAGRDYVDFYYAASPPLARFIAEHEWLRVLVRKALIDPLVAAGRATKRFWSTSQAVVPFRDFRP